MTNSVQSCFSFTRGTPTDLLGLVNFKFPYPSANNGCNTSAPREPGIAVKTPSALAQVLLQLPLSLWLSKRPHVVLVPERAVAVPPFCLVLLLARAVALHLLIDIAPVR